MRKIVLYTERCKACEYCMHFCPTKAITQTEHFNGLGYKTITIDAEKCVCCGTCFTMCPDSVIEIYNNAEE